MGSDGFEVELLILFHVVHFRVWRDMSAPGSAAYSLRVIGILHNIWFIASCFWRNTKSTVRCVSGETALVVIRTIRRIRGMEKGILHSTWQIVLQYLKRWTASDFRPCDGTPLLEESAVVVEALLVIGCQLY